MVEITPHGAIIPHACFYCGSEQIQFLSEQMSPKVLPIKKPKPDWEEE